MNYFRDGYSTAIFNIKQRIPLAILNDVFQDTPNMNSMFHQVVSLDAQLRKKIIENIVLQLFYQKGGITMNVGMHLVTLEDISRDISLSYRITVPDAAINGGTIIFAKDVSFFNKSLGGVMLGNVTGTGANGSGYLGAAKKLYDSVSSMPDVNVGRLQLGEVRNEVYLLDTNIRLTNMMSLNLIVVPQNILNNISPAAFALFSDMCVLATKAFIYNTLVITLDEGKLRGGRELGAYKEKISEYAESQAMLDELVATKLAKMLKVEDRVGNRNLIRMAVGGGV